MSIAQPATSRALPASAGRRPLVGVVGAGQLARMLYQTAIALDIELHVLAAHADDGAARIAADVLVGPRTPVRRCSRWPPTATSSPSTTSWSPPSS